MKRLRDFKMDEIFPYRGDSWRVAARTEHFIVATRAIVKGEPVAARDVVVVRGI